MKTLLFLLAFLCLNVSYAQPKILLSLFPNSGGEYVNDKVNLSFSLGETLVGAISNENYSINQGLQQSFFLGNNSTNTENLGDLSVDVFPNPFTDQVSFLIPSHSKITIEIYDVVGKLVRRKNQFSGLYTISLPEIQPGVYYVKAISKNKSQNTFTIIKI